MPFDDIPRKQRKVKKQRVKKPRCSFPQSTCSDVECIKFETQPGFDEWLQKNRTQFNSLNVEQQTNYIGSFVHWPPLKRATDTRKWIEKTTRKRFPSNYVISINGVQSFGTYQICKLYLAHIFSIGVDGLNTIFERIWSTRLSGLQYYKHVSNYKGYKNQEREEPEWIPDIAHHLNVEFNLSNEHYVSRRNGCLYIELVNGQIITKEYIWHHWKRKTQPESYEHYIVNKGAKRDDLKPLVPSLGHFKRTVFKYLNVKIKRPGKDECNDCTFLSVLLKEAATERETNSIKKAIKAHQKRYLFLHSYNRYLKWKCILSVVGDVFQNES